MSRKPLSLENNPLFGGPSLAERAKSGSPYREVALEDIDVDPDQPRTIFDDEALEQLAASIKEYGVLCPILVRPNEGGTTFRLISGERRLRASRALGRASIPAIVDGDEGQADDILAKQLVENLQRQDLTPLERAQAIGILKDRYSLSVREIGQKLGISKSSVQRGLEVLNLPEDMVALLASGLAESKVLLISQIKNKAEREEFAKLADGISRAELDKEIAKRLSGASGAAEVSHGGTGSKKGSSATMSYPEDSVLVDELQKSLGTKIKLKRQRSKPSRGKLIVEFYNEDDLQEVYERLLSE